MTTTKKSSNIISVKGIYNLTKKVGDILIDEKQLHNIQFAIGYSIEQIEGIIRYVRNNSNDCTLIIELENVKEYLKDVQKNDFN